MNTPIPTPQIILLSTLLLFLSPHPFLSENPPVRRQLDVTTPITTISSTPIPTAILNPTDSGHDSPLVTPANGNSVTQAPAKNWCIASQAVSQAALQAALDYACGHGGADCSEIQPGGSCYSPTTVRDHASYAFNSYYQKNPVPNSCNFGGSAVTTASDPSSGACQYPSISTTSSVLNTTNLSGSRVFGAGPGPTSPSTSTAATASRPHYSHYFLAAIVVLIFR